MEEWVKDLGEQNAMLVRTIEELEREAANRVILLEEKLQQSAAAIANINRCNMGDDGVSLCLCIYQQKSADSIPTTVEINFTSL